jgi:hypothetical protein
VALPLAVQVKFSKEFEAVRSRIRRLPQLGVGLMEAGARSMCLAVRDRYQQGLEQADLRLRPLRPTTVASKGARGLEAPEIPLYGMGMEEPHALINAMEVVKVAEHRWALRPRDAWHHGKGEPGDAPRHRIRLRELHDVHEYGATIANGFGRGVLIRIPPRPALRYAYRRVARGIARRDRVTDVRDAMGRYVRRGDRAALARVRAKR